MALSSALVRELLAQHAIGGSGLYEVIWDLNTREPSEPEVEKVRACIPVLSEFVGRGWVELYRERWATQLEEPVQPESALQAAADPRSWAAPSHAEPWYFCFVITEAGRLAHSQGLI